MYYIRTANNDVTYENQEPITIGFNMITALMSKISINTLLFVKSFIF